jgi:hypothetical protein
MKIVERHEDMSPDGFLRLIVQDDGDIIVAVVPDPGERDRGRMPGVEFCVPGSGGGRSTHTLRALRALVEAMERDNAERPIT